MKHLLCLACIVGSLSVFQAYSQTSLAVGDIAFTGYNADGDDDFSFIILKIGGIAAGTVIRFTDIGWNTGTCGSGGWSPIIEGDVRWTAAVAIPYGDQVRIRGLTAYYTKGTAGTVTGTALNLSSNGDQIFAYQGERTGLNTMLAAIHINGETGTSATNWDNVGTTDSSQSNKPACLVNGTHCLFINPETDNARLKPSVQISGNPATDRSRVNNAANWLRDDELPYSLPALFVRNVSSVTVPASGNYKVGDHLDFKIYYTGLVEISGSPYIPVSIGSSVKNAYYLSGHDPYVFRYTVASGDLDMDGIVVGTTIEGGTLAVDLGEGYGDRTLNNVGSTASVWVNVTGPIVNSINRQSPALPAIDASTAVFRVSFNEGVTGVDLNDFAVTRTDSATGSVASVLPISESTYDVTVNNVSGIGTIRVDLKAGGTGIKNLIGNDISVGYANGQTYDVNIFTWTGASDNSWANVANWNSGNIPGASTKVVIPSGAANLPIVLTGVRTVKILVMRSVSSLTVNGSLEITGRQ